MKSYSLKECLSDMYCDLSYHSSLSFKRVIISILFKSSLQFIWLYRIAHFFQYSRLPGLSIIFHYLQQILFSSCIHPKAKLGKNISFPHPFGIVIGEDVSIGNKVKIFQQVTVGSHGKLGQQKQYPKILDSTTIYAGAKIIGNVSIGRNSMIGANSVVLGDVPDNSVAVGVPAKVIRSLSDENA